MLAYPVRQFLRFAYPEPRPDFLSPADFGLVASPFEIVTVDLVRIAGWAFRPESPRGVVILCHSRGTDKSRVLGQAELLFRRGYLVVAFDFRGCGKSGPPPRRLWGSLWDPLHDLEAVVQHTVDRLLADFPSLRTRIALLGCSFGGNMVIAHAGHGPRHYPAVIFDSTPLVRWQDMLDTLLRRERRGARWRRVRTAVDWCVVRAVVLWTRATPLYNHATRSVSKLAGTVVLHIVGERDNLFDVAESIRFLEENCGGETEVWRVRRGRHLTNHLVDPQGYTDRIDAVLTRAFAIPTVRSEENA